LPRGCGDERKLWIFVQTTRPEQVLSRTRAVKGVPRTGGTEDGTSGDCRTKRSHSSRFSAKTFPSSDHGRHPHWPFGLHDPPCHDAVARRDETNPEGSPLIGWGTTRKRLTLGSSPVVPNQWPEGTSASHSERFTLFDRVSVSPSLPTPVGLGICDSNVPPRTQPTTTLFLLCNRGRFCRN
jgi:hypothetical protein